MLTPTDSELMPVEVDVVGLSPGGLDRVDPFLGIVVTRIVLALRRAEHLELVLVPADHDIEPESSAADPVGGDHLLRRDERMEQRRVHGAESDEPLGLGEEPRTRLQSRHA